MKQAVQIAESPAAGTTPGSRTARTRLIPSVTRVRADRAIACPLSTVSPSRKFHDRRRGRLRRLLRSDASLRRRQRERAADRSHRDGLYRGSAAVARADAPAQAVSGHPRRHLREAQLVATGFELGRFDGIATNSSPARQAARSPAAAAAPAVAEPPPPAPSPRSSGGSGPLDAAAIIVSNVIGGGILFTPPQVAAAVPHAWLFSRRLGRRRRCSRSPGRWPTRNWRRCGPRAGGEYVYLRAAYGRLAAFLTGWTSFVAGFSGAIAASAVVLARLRRTVRARGATTHAALHDPAAVRAADRSRGRRWWLCAAIALMSWIHLRGVGPGRLVGNVLAALKVSALLIFIALGLPSAPARLRTFSKAAAPVAGDRLAARADSGDVHLLGLERRGVCRRRDPRSGPQRAAGARPSARLAVIAIYVLLNLLYLYVLPVGELAAVQGSVLDVIADRLLGTRAGDIMGDRLDREHRGEHQRDGVRRPARLLRDGARRRFSFRAAARIHPRYQTPPSRSWRRRSGAACSSCPAARVR